MQPYALDTPKPDTHRQAAGPVFILADDLTGACDSGVAFLAAGRSARVVLNTASLDRTTVPPDSVLAVTTETRASTRQHASEQVARTVALLRSRATDPIFFKKIDSAARGHVGVETIAASTRPAPASHWSPPHSPTLAAPSSTASSPFATPPIRTPPSPCETCFLTSTQPTSPHFQPHPRLSLGRELPKLSRPASASSSATPKPNPISSASRQPRHA